MFTGLVAAKGRLVAARRAGSEMDLSVALGPVADAAELGASIAISGVCCTVTARRGPNADFRLSAETLARTWLGGVRVGQEVNLEAALRAGDPLGGHIVQGHVDGIGEVAQSIDARAGGEFRARIPPELMRYCVEKGSIALDGVSLTIASMDEDTVGVAVIPHTASHTTLGGMEAGQPLNIEVDVLAKYVERLLPGHRDAGTSLGPG